MRHLLLIGTLALTTLLTACSAHDDAEAGRNGMSDSAAPISFAAGVASMTRTNVVNSTTDMQDGGSFRVWAWMTDDEGVTVYPMTSDANHSPLQAVDVTWNNKKNVWQTVQTYYWPRQRYEVSFYAVYPASAFPRFNTSARTLDYTTTAVPGDVDVMYATCSAHRTTDDTKQGQVVQLHFRHALTQIAFRGQVGETFRQAGWKVEVSNITLHNICDHGSFGMDGNAFTGISGQQSYTFTMTPDEGEAFTTLPDDGTAIQLTSASPADMPVLMPQQHASWQPATESITATAGKTVTAGSYLAVTYHVCDAASADLIGTATGFETAYVPITVNWVSNTLYTYTITFGVGYNAAGQPVNDPIAVSASIHPWQETDESLETED